VVGEELTEIMEEQVELLKGLLVIVVSKLGIIHLHALIIHSKYEVLSQFVNILLL